jgi:hypothetical protein
MKPSDLNLGRTCGKMAAACERRSRTDRLLAVPALARLFLGRLTHEQALRPSRLLVEWQLSERALMLYLVNQERGAHSDPPATVAEIERAERLAFGHSDYSSKWALYCAQLASGEEPWGPKAEPRNPDPPYNTASKCPDDPAKCQGTGAKSRR